jgi:microcystin-dependent protein
MANVITPQSGILDVNGQIRQSGQPIVTRDQVLALSECAVYATSNINGSLSPKVVSIDTSSSPAYDIPSNLLKAKTLSSFSEEVIGIATSDINAGNIGVLVTRGIINSTLSGTMGQPVYSDASGALTVSPISEKRIGYILSTGPNAKVFVDIRTENYAYWQQQIAASVVVPPGTMIQFAGNTPPNGYLVCDGQSYAVASYPNLHAAIGYTYGGSGPNFNVPDCRGLVMVGAGQHGTMTRANGTPYNGGSVGATRNDQFQSWHLGSNNDNNNSGRTVYAYAAEYGRASLSYDLITHTVVQAFNGAPGSTKNFRAFSDGINGTPRAGDETRPAEIAVLVCIKY